MLRRRSRGPLPDFVVIGAARSGTTFLERYLRSHPGIHFAPQKEVHFFDRDPRFAQGPDWYRRQFAGSRPGQVTGEATPTYMTVTRAAHRMADMIPEARLIAVLRNPVDRAWSLYWFARAWRAEDREPQRALRESMREEGPSDEPPRAYLGSYVQQLERFCGLYPRSALLVVLFDDLRADPRGTLATVHRFVGVDETFEPDLRRTFRNEVREARSETIRQWTRRVRTRFPRLGERIAMLNSRPLRYPPIDRDLRAELVEYFRPHNEALSKWLGRDVSHWNA